MSAPVSGFASCPARYKGRVVFRRLRGGLVWAVRPPRSGDQPPPACLFVPCASKAQARAWAAAVGALPMRTWVRPGRACAVWASGPMAEAAPAWALKIALWPGLSVGAARLLLRAACLRAGESS